MKKIINIVIFGCILSGYCFSQNVNNKQFSIEITNVVINGGPVYLLVFSNAESWKNSDYYLGFTLEADTTILSKEFLLPNGEYVITAFQDANNNRTLDTGLFGIPKELFGISNYFGKGYPSYNFDKYKILTNNLSEKITIGLHKI
jgi:uncharacterized protein (DUF2141 family)